MHFPLFEAIDGHVVVAGYAPDGDSVRFLPAQPERLDRLRRAALLRRSSVDGSVQLRLEGIDAPELHYGTMAQPRGTNARDALLSWLGVRDVECGGDGATVMRAAPIAVAATILANAVDPRGRPIAFLLRARRETRARQHRVTPGLLEETANYALVGNGHAYPLCYTSLPPVARNVFREAARRARKQRLGVWKDDATAEGFLLRGERSLGPNGALVFPKLFRRCVDYLAHRIARGYAGSFVDWLRGHGTGGAPTPDRVVLAHAANVPFATVVREREHRIALTVDLLNLVFVEE